MSKHSSTLLETSGLALAINAEGEVPEWIELIPAGIAVIGRDGRAWINDDPAGVVAASAAEVQPLPLDWEHATEERAPEGLEAPAAGWIDRLEVREGGAIWGRVAWTPRGGAQVAAKEYRFVSPVFTYDKLSRRIGRLTSVGLTNTPNLSLTALNRQGPNREKTENALSLAIQLRTLLGLGADASDDAIVVAVREDRAANRSVDLTKYAPRADLEVATNRVTALETDIKTRDQAARTKAIEEAITAAQDAGKIAPASVDDYRAMCRTEGGLEAFQKLAATLPVILTSEQIAANRRDPKAQDESASGLTEEEKAVCRQLGQSEEAFAAGKASSKKGG